MGAGSPSRRKAWTNPSAPSMFTLHGRSYHRIFDAQAVYYNYNVTNNSRLYIYDGEIDRHVETLNLHNNTTTPLRQFLLDNNQRYRTYRSAVYDLLNRPDEEGKKLSPAYIEFEPITRALSGPHQIVGEIATLIYNDSTNPGPRVAYTFPRERPDDPPRFIPLWPCANETLQ